MGLFGSDLRFVSDTDGYARLNDLLNNAKERITILSPYVGPAEGHTRKLAEKSRSGVRVTVVFRRDKLSEYKNQRWFEECVESGVQLLTVDRLHSKLYLTDRELLLSSMNFMSTSGDNSYEAGVLVEEGHAIYEQASTYITRILGQYAQPVTTSERAPSAKKPRETKKRSESGFCIRCQDEIPLSKSRPLCEADYETWAEYKNKDYSEKYCHQCGEPNRTSVREPICEDCS